ncbi:MAG: hypothetical protein LBI54_03710 [Lachnospiraceae bacterium]|jgi:hypothetical protein|nr:hypothetical protein [Lachnospiraceae bacterium]
MCYAHYTVYFAALVVLAVIIMHAPLLTTDRLYKIHLLQYSSALGRRVLGRQLAAVLLSTIMLITVLVVAGGGMYALKGTQVFWHSYVSSFNSRYIFALPLTYGQYVWLLVGMVYVFGMAVSVLVFMLSRFCANYIPLIAGGICLGATAIILSNGVLFAAPLSMGKRYVNPVFYEPVLCGVVFLICVVAGMVVIWREKRVEVV